LIKEGTTKKVSQFIMPLKSISSISFCFNKDKCIYDLKTFLTFIKLRHSAEQGLAVTVGAILFSVFMAVVMTQLNGDV
jgi:hypothetical protein